MNVSTLEYDFPRKLQALPTLLVDSREQTPLPFTRLQAVRAGLVTGDYSVHGAENLFAIERKSIADLVSSITVERDRFERELIRLRGYEFKRLLIIGSPEDIQQQRYRSRTTPAAVMATISAFDARYVPVVFAATPEVAGLLVERWAAWFAYSLQSIAKAISHIENGSTRTNELSQKLEPSGESSANESTLA